MIVQIMAGMPPKKKKSRIIEFLLIFAIAGLIAGGAVIIAIGYGDYEQMRDMRLTWTKAAETADRTDSDAPSAYIEIKPGDTADGMVLPELAPKEADPDDLLYRSINLKALREMNPDVSGYIYSPNTAINYPILKETEPGRYYYLTHNIDNEDDRYGSIFELCDDERGVPGINNAVNIIFGHNMASGAMFAGLNNYKYEGFDQNPVYIYRDDYRIEYRAFASCIVNAYDSLYDFDAYPLGSGEYEDLLKWIMSKNNVAFTAQAPGKNTPIVVLSTCNDAHSDVRHIVCLVETRRALVPEYYESIKEVGEYGGDRQGISRPAENASEMPDYRQDIIDRENRNRGIVIEGR